MKKIIAILISLLTLCLAVCSCSKRDFEPYTVYELGGYENLSTANHVDDITFKQERTKELKIFKTKKYEFNEKEYELSYVETEESYLYNSEMDTYSYRDSVVFLEIGINPRTNKIIKFISTNKNYKLDPNKAERSKEECLQIAKDFISDYVENVEEYELTVDNSLKYNEVPDYNFQFSRYIDGMKTYDVAQITITSYGDIVCYRFYCYEGLNDVTLPDENTLEELRGKVNEKLDNIYSDMKNEYRVEYANIDERLLRTTDGRYAIEYCVNVSLVQSKENTITDVAYFIVYLN